MDREDRKTIKDVNRLNEVSLMRRKLQRDNAPKMEAGGIASYEASPLGLHNQYESESGKLCQSHYYDIFDIPVKAYNEGYVKWLEQRLLNKGSLTSNSLPEPL